MKSSLVVAAAAATCFDVVAAHYRWTSFNNPSKTTDYQYVRQNTNYNSPVTDVTSKDIVCNAGGLNSPSTSVASVTAGSTIGFTLDQAIYHNGPVQVYMSKSTASSVASYDGSGDWFKVAQIAPSCSSSGCDWTPTQVGSINFKLPASIPSGQYLVRVEQIGLHAASGANGAQFYISCANINVTGGGSGSPGPTIKFPGGYKSSDPGLQINIYYPVITSYPMPGPAVWTG